MDTPSLTTTHLKQQIHQLIEQLPPEQLPTLLHFSEGLLQPGQTILGRDNSTFTSSQPPALGEHPWLKYAEILNESTDWDEFLEALAEIRREDNQVEMV